MMGLQLSEKETLYHRKQMFENMKVHGIVARIDSIGDKYDDTYDFYNDVSDVESSYDDHIDTWITYEEVPTIKTLKSLGWYVETETFPVIAYIPVLYLGRDGEYSTFKPCLDDKVTLIANPIDENPSVRQFLIKDFKGNGFPNVIYYTVKLVPMREDWSPQEPDETPTDTQEDTVEDTPESGSSGFSYD